MAYHQQLHVRMEGVGSSRPSSRIGHDEVDRLIIDELDREFNLSQYDLDESDILRAIKIESILERYESVFGRQYALKIFYSIAKAGVINAAALNGLIRRPNSDFKSIIDAMIRANLVYVTADRDLSLTYEGKSLAEKIGVDIYIV